MNQHHYTNDLINETSPYLLQHAHNPVNWSGWNSAALKRARDEDKLLIISIGYSACHWCHVMEHESFEDPAVAAIMNQHFVSIKVDREERPDIDQIYMDAVQLISGRGGWPLNAIALPDGRPIYAGTYFPNQHWQQVLLYFVDYWKNKKDEAFERAAEITSGIKTMDTIKLAQDASFTHDDIIAVFNKIDSTIDYAKGGRRGAPKFPMPAIYRYLLRHHYYTGNTKALDAVTVTLDNMMNGGIYDQAGGGFARYSVDADWEIPHFEKMLYDNGQLLSLYAEAYQVTRNPRYKEVIEQTFTFLQRELSHTSGGFYSALDADSEGEEGKFYVWDFEELKTLLGQSFGAFCNTYQITEGGNFEGKINLVRKPDATTPGAQVEQWMALLLAERAKRVRPGLDDKILTSWNALAILGLTDAYKALGNKNYLDRALTCANFIKDKMLQPDGSLLRNYKNDKVTINGFLDDYSFTCQAYIALYEITFDEAWLALADKIANHVIQHFSNITNGLFFYTSVNDDPLIARKTESADNVIPASNSSMAHALYRLGVLLDKEDFKKAALKALANMRESIIGYPGYYSNWAMLALWAIQEPYEVVVAGNSAKTLGEELNKEFLPNSIIAGSDKPSQLALLKDRFKDANTLIYVCQNKTCGLPVSTAAEALKQLKQTDFMNK